MNVARLELFISYFIKSILKVLLIKIINIIFSFLYRLPYMFAGIGLEYLIGV